MAQQHPRRIAAASRHPLRMRTQSHLPGHVRPPSRHPHAQSGCSRHLRPASPSHPHALRPRCRQGSRPRSHRIGLINHLFQLNNCYAMKKCIATFCCLFFFILASFAQLIPDGIYFIRCASNLDYVVTPKGGKPSANNSIVITKWQNSNAQKWKVENQKDGSIIIHSMANSAYVIGFPTIRRTINGFLKSRPMEVLH